MSLHFKRELKRFNRRIQSILDQIQINYDSMMQVLASYDKVQAEKVMAEDAIIDELEMEIQEDCLKILALYQPAVGDLRYIVMHLRVHRDLERIGNLVAMICRRCSRLEKAGYHYENVYIDLAEKAKMVLLNCFDLLLNPDSQLARHVIDQAGSISPEKKEHQAMLLDSVKEHPEQLEIGMQLVGILRHLDRIGDHCANIARDTMYFTDGDIMRHVEVPS